MSDRINEFFKIEVLSDFLYQLIVVDQFSEFGYSLSNVIRSRKILFLTEQLMSKLNKDVQNWAFGSVLVQHLLKKSDSDCFQSIQYN